MPSPPVPRVPARAPRCLLALVALLCAVLLTGCGGHGDTPASTRPTATPAWAAGMDTVTEDELPAEARDTLALIARGGPYPYAKDGAVFGNFERILPPHERGYYREYTVPTPGENDRGARRVVTGRGGEVYYTDDHYESFEAVLR